VIVWLTAATALACAVVGGIFFAFSSFVMPALGRIPPAESIRGMQRINVDVFHWSFMAAFFGTPIACIAVAAQAIWKWDGQSSLYSVVGCAVYLLGTLLVTAACNVPRNDALAKVDADAVNAAREWSRYAVGWTRWNHVRTVASITAAVAFLAALTTL
jgi:uncharacterized membrane protein